MVVGHEIWTVLRECRKRENTKKDGKKTFDQGVSIQESEIRVEIENQFQN
jgi:hypothetical protein